MAGSTKGRANSSAKRKYKPRPTTQTATLNKTELKRLASAIDVTEFVDYRLYLDAIYKHIKDEKKTYSYLQYAEDLGFSKSNVVWQIIAEKRGLTPKACQKVAEALGLTGISRRYFITLRNHNNARKPDDRVQFFNELMDLKLKDLEEQGGEKNLEYFAEWFHPVIREMVGMKTFESSIGWILSKLNFKLMPKEVQASLDLLEKLELIQKNPKTGGYELTVAQIMPDRKVGKVAGVRYHQKVCDIARESITRVPNDRRDLNALTVCINEENAKEISKIIRKACEDIMKLEQNTKNADQVYQVNMQMFPYTK